MNDMRSSAAELKNRLDIPVFFVLVFSFFVYVQNLPSKFFYSGLLAVPSTIFYALCVREATPAHDDRGNGGEGSDTRRSFLKPRKTRLAATSHSFRAQRWVLAIPFILLGVTLASTIIIPGDTASLFAEPSSIPALLLLRSLLSISVFSFLPGLSILRLLVAEGSLSLIERLTISWLLSTLVVSLSTLFVSSGGLPVVIAPAAVCGLTLVLLIAGSAVHRRGEPRSELPRGHGGEAGNWANLFLVSTVGSFLAIVIVQNLLNPILVQGDLWNHANQSAALLRGQEEFFYPWLLHFYVAGLAVAAGLPVVNVYSTIQVFSVMCIFAFYALAKKFSKHLSSLGVTIATFLFTFSMGFGWVLFILLRDWYAPTIGLFGLDQALLNTSQRTYDLNSGIFHLRFYLYPFDISFAALLLVMSMMLTLTMRKVSRFMIIMLLVMTSFLVHVFEIDVFAILLLVISFLSPNTEYRRNLRPVSLAALMALLLSLFIDFLAPSRRFLSGIYLQGSIVAVILSCAALASTYLRWDLFAPLSRVMDKVARIGKTRFVALVMLALAVPLTFYAAVSIPQFFVWYVYDFGAVPWYLYPVRIGILSLLGLAGALLVMLERDKFRDFLIVVALSLLAIVVGRMATLLPYRPFAFGEFRIMDLMWPGVSIFAAFLIIRAIKRRGWPGFKGGASKRLSLFGFIFIVITAGVSSTLLYNEMKITPASQALSQSTRGEMDALLTIYNNFSNGLIAAPTFESRTKIRMYALTYRLDHAWSDTLFRTTQPQSFFTLLEYLQQAGLTHLYFSKFDNAYLQNTNNTLGRLVRDAFPTDFENDGVTLSSIPEVTGPSQTSSIAVATGEPVSPDFARQFLTISMMALANLNYTIHGTNEPPDSTADKFLVTDLDLPPARLDGYLDWARTGKTLIIINTSDKSDEVFSIFDVNRTQGTSYSDTIKGAASTIATPQLSFRPLQTPTQRPRNYTTLADYRLGNQPVSPLAIKKAAGSGQVLLVDLEPFMESILQNLATQHGRQLYGLLASIPRIAGLPASVRPRHAIEELFLAADGEVRLSGDVALRSPEMLLPMADDFGGDALLPGQGLLSIGDASHLEVNGTIVSSRNYSKNFGSIQEVIPQSESLQSLTTTNITLHPHGKAGYVQASIHGSFNYTFKALSTSDTTLKVGDGSSVTKVVLRGGTVTMRFASPTPMRALVLMPTVTVKGEAMAENVSQRLWELWASQKVTIPSGGRLLLHGNISMELATSDMQLLLLAKTTYSEYEVLGHSAYTEFQLQLPQPTSLSGVLLYASTGVLSLVLATLIWKTIRRTRISCSASDAEEGHTNCVPRVSCGETLPAMWFLKGVRIQP